MSDLKIEGPFFRDESTGAGLRFTCTRCSACCRFDSGYVWLSAKDLASLCRGLRLTESQVISRYCRVVNISGIKRISLAEQPNMDCIFWTDGACSIYENRPLQCRSFPFWAPYLGSREEWNELETVCPGVNIGERHKPRTIEKWLDLRQREQPLDAESEDEEQPDEG